MSRIHQKEYLKQRNELRENYIFEESERQRLRAIVIHCQLLRLFLTIVDFEKAHNHLRLCFKNCKTTQEHLEILKYCHEIFKEFYVI